MILLGLAEYGVRLVVSKVARPFPPGHLLSASKAIYWSV